MNKEKLAADVVDSVINVLPEEDADSEYMITLVNNAIINEGGDSLSKCAVSIVLVDELIEAIEDRKFMSMMRFELEIVDREALIYVVENVLDDYEDYFKD